MRVAAPLVAAALLATTAGPALAVKRTVRVPVVHCTATVETPEASVTFSGRRELPEVDVWGAVDGHVRCPS